MTTALLSLALGKPIAHDMAMTGELSTLFLLSMLSIRFGGKCGLCHVAALWCSLVLQLLSQHRYVSIISSDQLYISIFYIH